MAVVVYWKNIHGDYKIARVSKVHDEEGAAFKGSECVWFVPNLVNPYG